MIATFQQGLRHQERRDTARKARAKKQTGSLDSSGSNQAARQSPWERGEACRRSRRALDCRAGVIGEVHDLLLASSTTRECAMLCFPHLWGR